MASKNTTDRHPIFGTSPVPLYYQLAEIFRQRIGRGIWTPGNMLPSIESLMKEFTVARITVRQGIRLLSDEGLVTAQRGKGTFVNKVNSAQRLLRVHTTLAGLVDMYRGDKPVLTNLEESDAFPELLESDGIAAPGYFHLRRVHARDDIRYCVISIYIAEQVFRMAETDFRNEAVLPILFSLPGIDIKNARQTMHISKADAEIANLLAIPVGEPMAEVRRVITAPDNTVIYLAEVSYRGDYIHLDMDLKP
jgi:GntR family transcriptional regulator